MQFQLARLGYHIRQLRQFHGGSVRRPYWQFAQVGNLTGHVRVHAHTDINHAVSFQNVGRLLPQHRRSDSHGHVIGGQAEALDIAVTQSQAQRGACGFQPIKGIDHARDFSQLRLDLRSLALKPFDIGGK